MKSLLAHRHYISHKYQCISRRNIIVKYKKGGDRFNNPGVFPAGSSKIFYQPIDAFTGIIGRGDIDRESQH